MDKKIHNKFKYIALLLIAVTLASIVKRLFVGLDVDEEYAVTLAYRIAKGDILIKELWEPHQLSAIVPGLLCYLWICIKGNAEYLLLVLRSFGVLFQLLTAYVWYKAFSVEYGKQRAFISAIIIMNVLPKWIQMPDFSNTEIWCLLLLISFWKLHCNADGRIRNAYVILMGLVTVLLVWAYPSCILLFVLFLWEVRKNRKDLLYYFLTCLICAVAFVSFLLANMSLGEMLTCIGFIRSDTSHSYSIAETLLRHGKVLLHISGLLLIYSAIGTLLAWLFARFKKLPMNIHIILALSTAVSCIDQLREWFISGVPNVLSSIRFLIPLIALIVVSAPDDKEKQEKRICILASVLSLISVLLLTNLTIESSLVHMLPAVLYYFLSIEKLRFADKNSSSEKIIYKVTEGIWTLVAIIGLIMLVRVNEGRHEDIFLVRQKALSGVVKNVYCPYMVGYEYNDSAAILSNSVEPGSKVLYIGTETTLYASGNYEVCAASTISTPVYDEKYIRYFSMNESKMPDVVIIDKNYWDKMDEKERPMAEWIDSYFDWQNAVETDFIFILNKKS